MRECEKNVNVFKWNKIGITKEWVRSWATEMWWECFQVKTNCEQFQKGREVINIYLALTMYQTASQVAQWWKICLHLPATQESQETWVQSLSQEDPLEEGMATHSSILARRIPWMEKATVRGVAKSQTGLKRLSSHACTHTLVVQQTWVWFMFQEDPTYCGETKPVRHNCWSPGT